MAYLTIEEAAEMLKMKPSTIRRKIRDGLVPVHRLGGSTCPARIDSLELRHAMSGLSTLHRDMELF